MISVSRKSKCCQKAESIAIEIPIAYSHTQHLNTHITLHAVLYARFVCMRTTTIRNKVKKNKSSPSLTAHRCVVEHSFGVFLIIVFVCSFYPMQYFYRSNTLPHAAFIYFFSSAVAPAVGDDQHTSLTVSGTAESNCKEHPLFPQFLL